MVGASLLPLAREVGLCERARVARQFLMGAVEDGVPLSMALAKVVRATGARLCRECGHAQSKPAALLRAINAQHNPTRETLEGLLKPFDLRVGLQLSEARFFQLHHRVSPAQIAS